MVKSVNKSGFFRSWVGELPEGAKAYRFEPGTESADSILNWWKAEGIIIDEPNSVCWVYVWADKWENHKVHVAYTEAFIPLVDSTLYVAYPPISDC